MPNAEFDRRRLGAYLGLGLGLALSVGAFVGLGFLLDRRLGTVPLFTILGAFLGAAGGFYSLYRHVTAVANDDRATSQKSNEWSRREKKTTRERD